MPKLSNLTLSLVALLTTAQAPAQQPVLITPVGAPNPFLQFTAPAPIPFGLPQFSLPTLPSLPDLRGVPIPLIGSMAPAPTKPYTMRPGIPQQTKKQMMQMMMPIMSNVMRMSMPDAMNWFAHKIKAKPGLSFDDVVESMMLRANKLNFKYVGNNLMYKDFRAVLGDVDAPRIEVHSFCDIAVGRDLLKISPEFLVFLPCRVGVMEDADKNIWVMMLDWNLDWVAGYEGQMGVSPELAKGAVEIRNKMAEIMQAGADGDL
jgi:uncharacterized protein (DUF302 family)